MPKLTFSDYGRILMGPNHLKCLIFSVTSRCNARCKMCIYWDRLNKSAAELKLSEIESICQKAGDLVGCILTGGEPFLRSDLDEIAYLFARYNRVKLIHISTMGYASKKIAEIAERMVRKCKDSTVTVDLSIDGVGSHHDAIRGVRGLFERVIATYVNLNQIRKSYSNLRIKVNTVISSYNQDNVMSIVNFVKENMQVDDHSLTLTQGKPKEKEAKEVSPDRFNQFINEFEATQYHPRADLFEKLFKGLRKEIRDETIYFQKTGKFTSPCRAIRNFLFIDEEGGVYPCLTIRQKIGDLRRYDYDLKRILNSRQRHEIDKKYKISTSCACDWDCGYLFNVIYDLYKYPRLLKYAITYNKKFESSI